MKALVLSGGEGTRLRPLTYTMPKQLVPIANRPILHFVLEAIIKCKITEIGIVVSPQTQKEIREAVEKFKKENNINVNFTFILQEKPLGLAHAVKVSKPFLKDSSFLMYLGDNLIGQDLTGFIEEFKNQGPECLIFLREVKDPSRFGVVILDEDKRVKKLIEKPREPISKLALVGVYIFSPLIHKAIQNINFSWRGELEITDAIQELLNMGKEVKAEVLNSWWLDTGKKDDLLEANRVVLDGLVKADIKGKINDKSIITGRAEIGKNTIVENSEIRGPVVIGKDAVIYGSFIGPYTSIGDGCHIEESSIEFSVILPEAKIRGIERLDESLIGRRTEVVKATKVNKALRLMLGDDAKVDL